jgi:signal transduction histidine kinase
VPADQSSTQLLADLQHRDRQIEAIRRTSDALFSHPSVDAMVEATLKIALDVLRADAGTVFLHDSQADSLVFRYVIGGAADKLMGQAIPRAQGGVAWTVFETGKPDLVADVTKRGDFNKEVDKKTGYQTQSMMTVPVKRAGGAPIGVMQVLNAHIDFDTHDLEVLEVLCAQAATGIEHARLVEAQKGAEIGNRVGEIAHDIKNMMTPIETGVMTLEPMLTDCFMQLDTLVGSAPNGGEIQSAMGGIDSAYGWLLSDILTAAQRVRRRTEYIAGMVKGQLPPPRFEEGDLHGCVNDVIKTLRRTATEKGLTLTTALDATMKPLAFDYDRIYDALYNLVNNALPETPTGGTVTVKTTAPGADGWLTIEVIDTGRGIPPHVLEKLFTRDAVSTKVGGTGLGTSVAARVAREHGGKISVQSTVGQGTTFTIRFPAERPL